MERKQFTFYRSFYDCARKNPDPLERLGFYEAVIAFALEGKEPQGLSLWQDSLFTSILPHLESSARKAKAGIASAKKRSGNKNKNKKENEVEKENEIELKKELKDECLSGVGFTEFWNHYPLKVGKQKALAVWEKSVKEPQAVLEGLEKWKRCSQWNRENGRFVPRAAKFLEDEDWRADPPGYVPTGGTGKLGEAELEAIARMMASDG